MTAALLALAALAAPEVRVDDPARAALAPPDGADLVLVYAAGQDGAIGPCGCGGAGGLPRLGAYVGSLRERGEPVLLLAPGGWMASVGAGDALSSWSVETNAWFHRALAELRYDALLVSYRDLAGAAAAGHPGYVSATHRPAALPVARYKVFDVDGLRVAVTGVSRDGLQSMQPALRGPVAAPVPAVRALLPELADADVVVVLAFEVPREVPALAALPGVDVVIEAADYDERWPAVAEGDAVWVRSLAGGVRAGELRLWVEDGRVVRAVDRQVPLDDTLAGAPRLKRLQALQEAATAP
ncbi:MAG: hypothetical protein R2724_34870 [Bryobacterales bacterium]